MRARPSLTVHPHEETSMGTAADPGPHTSNGNGAQRATHAGASASPPQRRRGAALGAALGDEQRPLASAVEPYQQIADDDRGTGGESTADFLGYFSLGLGLAELLAPETMNRVIGVKHPDARTVTTMRLMGLREIGHGLAILTNQHPEKAVWSRVAGDALDLALLGRTWANPENDRGRTLFATLNVLAVGAVDVITARQLSRQPQTVASERMAEGIVRTKRSVTVRRPVEEVYGFWRDFENLPRFMRHLESVTVTGEGRSHWKALAPAGQTVEWDAETTADEPNERIAWRSLPGAAVYNAGEVRFQPAPGGPRHRAARHARVRPAVRQARLQGRDALPRGARAAGRRRPAPLQAGDGDRRDRALRRHQAAGAAPGASQRQARPTLSRPTAPTGARR
jgi:uncharacterized membrane protein